ncbi:response regulator transcription factor [Streptomyces sp. NPDC002516]
MAAGLGTPATTRQVCTSPDLCPGGRTSLLSAAETTAPSPTAIALLTAAGAPSRGIAGALHLSVRTVDNHLQRAYAKLGVTTRLDLATTLGIPPT